MKSKIAIGMLVLLAASALLYTSDVKKVSAAAPEVSIKAGQISAPFSYWGFEKSGEYTTVRLQTVISYPIATYTFKDSELPVTIRIGGEAYEIVSYSNTKIAVRQAYI